MRITLAEAGSCDPVPVLEIGGWGGGEGGRGGLNKRRLLQHSASLCAQNFDGGIATADMSYSMTCMCVHLFQDHKA
jgi:hypothetical protein